MGILKKLAEKIRKHSLSAGYVCDDCGRELFDYPVHRLCAACEEKLIKPIKPCEKCGREKRAQGLCLDCKSVLPSYTRGISPFVYQGETAALINRMKNGYSRIAAYFGERMAEKFLMEVGREWSSPLLLIPVPMTKEGIRARGYNQAERLAESICERLNGWGVVAETDFTLLEKGRETKPQKQMTRKERTENVAGAFHVHKRKACQGRVILLIDYVCTTGATANECAKKLCAAGASAVYFLSVATLKEPQ